MIYDLLIDPLKQVELLTFCYINNDINFIIYNLKIFYNNIVKFLKLLIFSVISCQGFTRVLNHGEVKKEYDSFMLKFDQEQHEIELQSLNVATQLQVNLANN